jgi:hypothetical protein
MVINVSMRQRPGAKAGMNRFFLAFAFQLVTIFAGLSGMVRQHKGVLLQNIDAPAEIRVKFAAGSFMRKSIWAIPAILALLAVWL